MTVRVGDFRPTPRNIKATSREGTGWDTQKPLALYERIIEASSNPGDLVLDPFCGTAATLVAARRLNRRFFGIDSNPDAKRASTERITSP